MIHDVKSFIKFPYEVSQESDCFIFLMWFKIVMPIAR